MPESTETGSGRLFLIAGPLGSGKQSIVEAALRARGDLSRAPLICCDTRRYSAPLVGCVSPSEFAEMRRERKFLACWDSDGVRYGLPVSVRDLLAAGRQLILSTGEAAIDEIAHAVPEVRVIHVSASEDILRKRISAMALFADDEIDRLIADSQRFRPREPEIVRIDTSGSLEQCARQIIAALDGPDGFFEPLKVARSPQRPSAR